MKIVIGEETNLRIKHLKRNSIIRLVVFSLVFIAIIIFSFVFQNRSNDDWFVILLALVSTIYAALMIYEVKLNLLAYNNYSKIIKHRLQVRKSEVTFLRYESKETYLGVTCHKLIFLENELKVAFYIEEEEDYNFYENKRYEIDDYHRFIISYKESEEDE